MIPEELLVHGDDDLVLPIMDDLRACLCQALAASPGGSPCFCGVVPGPRAIADRCGCGSDGCGQAWVRLDRVYPSSSFPQQDASMSACATGLAAVIELGVFRCVSVPNRAGGLPTAAALAEDTRIQMGDWAALRTTVACCPAVTRRQTVLGPYVPRGQGGCAGGALTLTVRLGRY